MKEAIGNSFVLNFIITFVALFTLVFVGTLSYTKAFKVKNRIIDIIENFDGNIEANDKLFTNVKEEIDTKLNDMSYKIAKADCENLNKNGSSSDRNFIKNSNIDTQSDYKYCIYRNKTNRGTYYSVVAYIYFEVPLIGAHLEFPVYGETRVFMNL